MTLEQAEQALASRPVAFTVHQDCVLVDDDRTPRIWTVAKHLQYHGGSTYKVEYLDNRRFVVAHLLDPLMAKPLSAFFDTTPEVCATIARIAEAYTERLRAGLRDAFPERSFEVEVTGADYVAEEPLEVSVTFARSD